MTKSRVLGVAVGLVAIVSTGCRRTTNVDMACEEGLLNEAQPCDPSDSCACGTEGICFDGLCRLSCESDASCSGGALCIKDSGGNGACMLLSEQACSATDPCTNPRLVCGGDGQCRLPCNDANPCRSNDQSCLFGACYGKNEPDASWLCEGISPRANGEPLRCTTDATMEICNVLGLGWLPLMTCASEKLCEAGLPGGACAPAVCSKDAVRCSGEELQICSDDLDSWELIQRCDSAALCQQGLAEAGSRTPACASPQCDAGEFGCEGVSMRVCKADRTGWELVQTCASSQLCDDGVANHLCAGATCLAGSVSCAGSVLQQCKADSTAYDVIDTCGSPELCARTLTELSSGEELACVQACTPEAYTCDGATLQRCLADGSGVDVIGVCATAALCDAAASEERGSCEEPACDDGEYRCIGAGLERCNSDRTGFEEAETCSSATMCLPGLDGKCMDGGEALIDNLEDGDFGLLAHDGRSGGWYSVSDPSADTFMEVVASSDRPGSLNAIHFLGSGFDTWGAEYGMALVADAGGETHRVYDASAYAGIQFWAKRGGGTSDVIVDLQPAKDFEEHGCVAAAGECWGGFGARVEIGQTWSLYQLRWDQLAPLGGTRTNDVPGIDTSTLVDVVFKFSPGDEVDLYVDDPAFMVPAAEGTCSAGALRCAGLGTNDDGTTFGPSLERCASDGQGWLLADNCGTARACSDPNLGASFQCALQLGVCPRACAPGSGECRGRESWVCNDDGTGYSFSALCDLPAYCVGGEHPRCTTPHPGVINDFEGGAAPIMASEGVSSPFIIFHQQRAGRWNAWLGEGYVGPTPTLALAADEARVREGAGYSVLDWRVEEASVPSGLGLTTPLAAYPNSVGRAAYPYDASSYAGIYLSARSPTGTAVRLRLTDRNTDHSSPDRVAPISDYGAVLALGAEWNTFVLGFEELTLRADSDPSLPARVDPATLYGIGVERPWGTAPSEVMIDDIGFYPASTPSPGCDIGGYSCLGPVLQKCQTDDRLTTVAICSSEASCLAGRAAGICVSDCENGDGLCMGAKRFECTTAGGVTGYAFVETCDSSLLCEAGSVSRCWDESLLDHFEGAGNSLPELEGRSGYWVTASWSEFGTATITNVFDGSGHFMRYEGQDLSVTGGNETIGLLSDAALLMDFQQAYDASGFSGVRFRARKGGGNGATSVRLEVEDAPNSPESPGTCDTEALQCYSFFGASFDVTTEWGTFEFAWDELERQWVPDPAPSAALATDALVGARWLVGAEDFVLELDDVQFF